MTELPPWYPIRKLKGEVDEITLETLGKRRIDLLIELARGGNINSDLLSDEYENAVSFLALILAAAVSGDVIFRNWVLESEGDLLSKLVRRASESEKAAVLKDVFEDVRFGWGEVFRLTKMSKEEVVQELSFLLSDFLKDKRALSKLYSDENSVVAVRFWKAPKALSRRLGILKGGWLITHIDVLLSELKSQYQKKVEKAILQRVERTEELKQFKDLAERLVKYWRSKRNVVSVTSKKVSIPIGEKLYEREDLWPPCMRILLSRLSTTGYLPHGERLQLGLFLKKLGMPLEEQLQFWYKFAVDNVGMSWEEFERKGGYYIKHIYGVVGSKKDYEAPKCDTIIAKYFCPFASMTYEELKEALKALYNLSASDLRDLMKEVRERRPKMACAKLLSKLTGKERDKEISHPLQFVRILYYSRRKRHDRRSSSDVAESEAGRNRSEGA